MAESATEVADGAGASAATATKQWFYRSFASPGEVVAFVNAHPAQGPGEFDATTRDDGTVDLFYYSTVA